MHVLKTFGLLAAIAFQPAPAAAAPRSGSAEAARKFLEAFAGDPSATKAMVTRDAVIAIGDIGGPYAEFLEQIRPKTGWLDTCRPASLRSAPPPFEGGSNSKDMSPRFRGGRIATFEGTMACTGPDGAATEVPVVVVLKKDLVVQFMMMMERD